MRASLFVLLLSALASSATAVPASDGDRGVVAVRQPTRIRPPRAVPPNLVPRARPAEKYDDRRSYVPRSKPSQGGDNNNQQRRNVVKRVKPSQGGNNNNQKRRNAVKRAKPSQGGDNNNQQRRNYVPRGKTPEKANDRRNYASRAQPVEDGTHRARRSQQEQDVIRTRLGWGQCPAPLGACPVRGASDVDDFECVDLWSDLDSCGGCAAENSAYDCTTIANARGVECVSGYCVVHSCMAGYTVALTRDGCIPMRSEKRRVGSQK